ncbi:MAG: hypothetical protein RLY78_3475 [Pseudomonadota bacterium]|jgi:rare lipoprotein A
MNRLLPSLPRDLPAAPRASRGWLAGGLCLLAAALAGCSSTPPADGGRTREASGDPRRDGPGALTPADVIDRPDAVPRVEPLRVGGPNKPYRVLGIDYEPMNADRPLREQGLASWYGRQFHGRPTASGEPYDMYGMTAAHRTMPLPSYARVRNPANGRSVIVRINDRGPFHAERVIDLSYTAAAKLGVLGGVAPVEVERLTHEVIASGAWRDGPTPVALAAASPAPLRPIGAGATAPAAGPSSSALSATATPVLSSAATAPAAVAPVAWSVQELPPAAPVGATPSAAGRPGVVPVSATDGSAARPALTTAAAVDARGWWLQIGAFRQSEGARQRQGELAPRVEALGTGLRVFADGPWHRLQAGPWASRTEAEAAVPRLQALTGGRPMVVERR